MLIVGLHHEGTGCSYHRVELPLQHMRGNKDDVVVLSGDSWSRVINWEGTDIVIFNRIPTMPMDKLLSLRELYGFKIVVDIDDHWILYPHHEMAETWVNNGMHEKIQTWLMVADMVFTTNERLRIAASILNNNVHVVPNGLPYDEGQFAIRNVIGQAVDYLYAGGSSHLHDLVTIKPVLKRLGSDGQFRVEGRIVLAGYNHQYGIGKVDSVWKNMLSIIALAKSYATLPTLPVYEYMRCYETADVSIAPLERSTFNSCKSNLKILEAGCKKIPIIASYVEPYVFDQECPGVILCDTNKEWYSAIKMLLNDPLKRESLGKQLGEYVRRKYHLKDMNDIRRSLFNQLLIK